MKLNDGGPAFPVECAYQDGQPVGLQTSAAGGWETGMTLRDWFAGKALMAMGPEAIMALTDSVGDYEPHKVDEICATAARMAYRFADAMLVARSPQVREDARHGD